MCIDRIAPNYLICLYTEKEKGKNTLNYETEWNGEDWQSEEKKEWTTSWHSILWTVYGALNENNLPIKELTFILVPKIILTTYPERP